MPILQRESGVMPTLKNTVVMMLAMSVVASAQWDPYPWKRVPRTADGKVDLNAPPVRTPYGKIDLSGFWMPENPTKHLLNLAADMKPEEVPLKPQARDLYNARIENNGKDHPGASCLPSGIPEKDNIPDGLKLVQTEDLTLLLHEVTGMTLSEYLTPRLWQPMGAEADATWIKYPDDTEEGMALNRRVEIVRR